MKSPLCPAFPLVVDANAKFGRLPAELSFVYNESPLRAARSRMFLSIVSDPEVSMTNSGVAFCKSHPSRSSKILDN